MLRIDDFVKSQLVLVGWQYGQMYDTGGHMCACLVMSCIANRVRAGYGDWLDVIEKIPLYAAEKTAPTWHPGRAVWERNFIKILQEVDGIFDGTTSVAKGKDIYGNVVMGKYWADLRHIETEFFRERILGDRENHPRLVDMNSFTIFA